MSRAETGRTNARWSSAVVLFVGIALALGAVEAQGEDSSPAGVSGVRVVYLSSSTPSGRIMMGSEEPFESVGHGVVTGYRAISSGDVMVTVLEQRSDTEDEGAESAERPVGVVLAGPNAIALSPDVYYTLLLTTYSAIVEQDAAEQQGGGTQDQISLHLLEDGVGNFPPAGRAFLRIVNVLTGLAGLDVTAWEDADDVLGASREQVGEEAPPPDEHTTLGEDIAFGEMGRYVDIDSGRYVIEFWSSGGDDVILESMAISLVQGAAYTVYLFGPADTGDVSVIVSVDALVRESSSGMSSPGSGAP